MAYVTERPASGTREGRLTGRRILITGAASGIGLATAKLFSTEGAAIAMLDRNGSALRTAARGLSASVIEVDVSDETSVRAAVATAASALSGIDGVVNAAGIAGPHAPFAEISLADWLQVLAVNLTGPFLVSRESLSFLQSEAHSTIVNVASASGLLPAASGISAYSASKGALITLSKAMAFELAPKVRVNVVCPGPVNTPLLPSAFRQLAELPKSSYPLQRIAEPEEIAQVILFASSFESSYVTGATLTADGGRTFH
jgi:NAD(P)-dependent dehydrogenase (short-subunit alcohol dehydrogenase family)